MSEMRLANACASDSTASFPARLAFGADRAGCALALGFKKTRGCSPISMSCFPARAGCIVKGRMIAGRFGQPHYYKTGPEQVDPATARPRGHAMDSPRALPARFPVIGSLNGADEPEGFVSWPRGGAAHVVASGCSASDDGSVAGPAQRLESGAPRVGTIDLQDAPKQSGIRTGRPICGRPRAPGARFNTIGMGGAAVISIYEK